MRTWTKGNMAFNWSVDNHVAYSNGEYFLMQILEYKFGNICHESVHGHGFLCVFPEDVKIKAKITAVYHSAVPEEFYN
jgi:hypothetical protein